jgi:serine/threonine protein kinase
LRVLDHPSLGKIFGIYEDSLNFYFITERIKGGDLFDALLKRGSFNEKDAATVIKQLLSVISYLHSKGVVHRD